MTKKNVPDLLADKQPAPTPAPMPVPRPAPVAPTPVPPVEPAPKMLQNEVERAWVVAPTPEQAELAQATQEEADRTFLHGEDEV